MQSIHREQKNFGENKTADAANARPYHRRDTPASRGKRKPDIDTIESFL